VYAKLQRTCLALRQSASQHAVKAAVDAKQDACMWIWNMLGKSQPASLTDNQRSSNNIRFFRSDSRSSNKST
jgi:hypothetical protein